MPTAADHKRTTLLLEVTVGTATVAVALSFLMMPPRQLSVPAHLRGVAVHERELLSPQTGDALRSLVKRLQDYPTNANDATQYVAEREHIGEAMPLGPNGNCTDPYMVPDSKRTSCVLAGRIDVARHFFLTGGLQGLREPFETLASRVQSFGRYMFDLGDHPEARALFADPRFQRLARRVCPAHKQHLDPFQFNLIIQLPGQTVAAHLDGAYFWGATRFQLPQWLLAAMVFSGRFAERFVDQVQVVAYLHEWAPPSRRRGQAGAFVHYANVAERSARGDGELEREAMALEAWPLAGSAIDGSKVVHAADVYLGGNHSPPLPRIDKSRRNILSFEGPGDEGGWVLRVDGAELQRYDTHDLRISIVYRARCFTDAAEAEHFDGNGGPAEQRLGLEQVLGTLAEEMARRGAVESAAAALALPRRALAVKLMDTFIRYPMPPAEAATVPFNYCMLPRVLPKWAAPLAEALLRGACTGDLST